MLDQDNNFYLISSSILIIICWIMYEYCRVKLEHTWKKYDFFSRVLLRLFSGPEILVQHRSLRDKDHHNIFIF